MRSFCSALAAVFVLGSLPSLAQTAVLERTDGVLGSATTYISKTTPGTWYVLAPSVTEGPLALSLFDITETRFLDVGFELFPLGLWKVGLTDGNGEGVLTYPLPLNPNLHGLPFYAQYVEIVFFPSLFGEISNRSNVTLCMPGMSVQTYGATPHSTKTHAAVTVPDGRVVLGGGTGAGTQIWLFEPATESFTSAGVDMSEERLGGSATLLQDGRVLFLGGTNELYVMNSGGDLYDPVTDTVTPTAPMISGRVQHTATVLDDGRVFVAGGVGVYDLMDPLASLEQALKSSEIYDPVADTWTPGPDLPKGLVAHRATKLDDGTVLLTGGFEVSIFIGLPLPQISSDARLYDPVTNSYLSAATMPEPRMLHGQVRMNNGKVLVAGGGNGSILGLQMNPMKSCIVYDPAFDTWAPAADLNFPRGYLNLLNNGDRLIATGGFETFDFSTFVGQSMLQIETADPNVFSWTYESDMFDYRDFVVSVLIDDGRRVLSTGEGYAALSAPDFTAEIFAP